VRVRIVRTPAVTSVDGLRLDQYYPGLSYEVGTMLAAYLFAEGWAEPASSDDDADEGRAGPSGVDDEHGLSSA
jgi:hypothetical protein